MNANLLNEAKDFYNSGNSMKATCKKFHTTPNILKKLFVANNIYIRTQKEQCIIENMKRANFINHNYFSVLNNQNVYYLGFLAADGCVNKKNNSIKICLSSVDKDFLEQMRKNLQIENTIKIYQTNNGFECCELKFSSLKIKQDLSLYGIVPNKTYIGLDLNLIPDEYKLAFIKGYFDGDGSFSYNKQTKQAKISFTSHTKNILVQISKYFGSGYIYQDDKKNYSLEFSTIPSLDIMETFYKLESPYLSRKRNKYLECLILRNNFPRDKAPLIEDEKIC